MAAEVCIPLFSDWHRPCHVIEGSPQGVAALAAAFETCGVSIEGRVSGHPAILGGLSSEPAASHPFETLFTGALVLEYGLLLGFLGGCCETPGGLVCDSFFRLYPFPAFFRSSG